MKFLVKASLAGLAFAALSSGALAQEPFKVAVAGDSTAREYAKDSPTQGWGQKIGELCKSDVKILNFAVSGRSTKTFKANGDWAKVLASKPDLILVQFGHNDSHAKDKPEATDAATDYKDYLRSFADDAKQAKAPVVFITPMHRRVYGKDGKPTQELLPYANAMKEVAKEKGIPLVDLHSASGKLLEELGEEPAAELFCSKADRTHFSDKGARAMAALIAGELKEAAPQAASRILK
jgi:lysophospholipase L1-like esterase